MDWLFDAGAAPGWFDYASGGLAIAGFIVALRKLKKTRDATTAATNALASAQKDMAQKSLLALVPQFQAVVNDLSHTMPGNDGPTTERVLLRFALLSRETIGLLAAFNTDETELSGRLGRAAEKATKAKGQLASAPPPVDVIAISKQVSKDIDTLTQDLVELASTIRNSVEGAPHV